MYLDHFGLHTDPFPLYPSLKFVFMSQAFEEAMAHLAYGLEQDEDIILITGPIGTGKTLAIHSLLANLSKRYKTAFVNVTQVDYPELLKLILADLGVPAAIGVDKGDLLASLGAQVREALERGSRLLIVIDEAQNLSPETLEGVRLLTNLGHPRGQGLQVILTGQPDLERKIQLPQLAQLRQRIRVHYRLETLARNELDAYVNHRLKVAGCEKPLFKFKALDLIYKASRGVPRLVNTLAARALLSAFVAGKSAVEVEHVDLSDLPPTGLEPGIGAAAAGQARPAPETAPASGTPDRAKAPSAPSSLAVGTAAAPAATGAPGRRASAGAPDGSDGRAVVPDAVGATSAGQVASAGGASGGQGPLRPMAAFAARRRRRPGWLFAVVVLLLVACAVVVFFFLPQGFGVRDATSRRAAVPEAGPASPAASSQFPPVATPAVTPAVTPADSLADAPVAGMAPAPEATAPSPPRGPGNWAIHVHSFRDMPHTTAAVDHLRDLGFPAFYRERLIEGTAWMRVFVGPYAQSDDAQVAANDLMARHVTEYAHVVRVADE